METLCCLVCTSPSRGAFHITYEWHCYSTNEIAEQFTSDEIAGLRRGEVIVRNARPYPMRWVSATALALAALSLFANASDENSV